MRLGIAFTRSVRASTVARPSAIRARVSAWSAAPGRGRPRTATASAEGTEREGLLGSGSSPSRRHGDEDTPLMKVEVPQSLRFTGSAPERTRESEASAMVAAARVEAAEATDPCSAGDVRSAPVGANRAVCTRCVRARRKVDRTPLHVGRIAPAGPAVRPVAGSPRRSPSPGSVVEGPDAPGRYEPAPPERRSIEVHVWLLADRHGRRAVWHPGPSVLRRVDPLALRGHLRGHWRRGRDGRSSLRGIAGCLGLRSRPGRRLGRGRLGYRGRLGRRSGGLN
jgi:hypothetical protein